MLEIRASSGIEHRGRTVVGYAAVYGNPTDLGDFSETILQGAFDESLRDAHNIRALYHHQSAAILGSTQARTLRLSSDSKGLAFELDLPNTTAGNDVLELVKRGDVAGCSFGFRIRPGGDVWERRDGRPCRELRNVELIEVTLTADPAYGDTSVALRCAANVAFDANHAWLETVKC